jgi:hypothetical protein
MHAIFYNNKFFSWLIKKSQQANRLLSSRNSYNSILCYLVSPCVAMSVYFSSTDERRGHGVEERNQKYLELNSSRRREIEFISVVAICISIVVITMSLLQIVQQLKR